MTIPVFSDYEVRQVGIRPKTEGGAMITADCVGKFEDEMTTKVITKKCRGVVKKTRVRGTGSGKANASLHMPIAMRKAMYSLTRDDLADGVTGYGENNVHGEFCMVLDVYDEDGVEKLVAYPSCIMETGPNFEVENGADEVAEVEIEISIMPDESGYGKYEAFANEVSEDIKSNWMTDFTSELVAKLPTV